jgi:nicotinamide mononucleotide transporter
MSLPEIYHQFIIGLQQTGPLEFVAALAGIASVVLSSRENIWVYPVGLLNTVIYIFISINGHLYGEASVNFYYTVMSIYGWILWARKDEKKQETILHITYSSRKEWLQQLGFFAFFYVVIYSLLSWLKQDFAPEAIPWADAFASATAYTGMWLMAKKKMENWYWWLGTNIASIPLYFVKGYVFTSVQFFVLLVINLFGLAMWMRKEKEHRLSNRKSV